MSKALTMDDVQARFEEAAHTARRLPPVRVQGYYSVWPTIVRTVWERLARDDEPEKLHFPPEADAVERMLETMRWVQWIDDIELRHLVWMRAKGYAWKPICHRFGCDRTTAWRRWQRALQAIVDRLALRAAAAAPFEEGPTDVLVSTSCLHLL